MSTNSQPSATGTVLRRKKDGSRVPVPCPESVILCNRWMGAVDYGDQLRGYYSCRTKSRKFYKYIYHFLLDVTITNSFILYKNFHPNPRYKTIREFRLQLARELIGDYCSRRRSGCHGGAIVPLQLQHFPTTVPSESGPRKTKGGVALAVLNITSGPTPNGFVTSVVSGCATMAIPQVTVFTCGIKIENTKDNTLMCFCTLNVQISLS